MQNLKELMEERLTPARFRHSLGVAQTAVEMARCYGVNPAKAELAGLVHDYARELPAEELLVLAKQLGYNEDNVLQTYPELLHAPLGAYLIKLELGINDQEIVQAVASHTLGNANMSKLEQIIYLADLIEPGRRYPGVDTLRKKAQLGLKEGIISAIDHTIRYLVDEGKPIHQQTIAARNSLIMGGE